MRRMLMACIAGAALAAAAALAGGQFAALQIASPTGGVARASAAVGEIAHIDYSTTAAGTLRLVGEIAGEQTASTTVVSTNAAIAGRWIPVATTVGGGTDYIEFEAATNASATVYILAK